MFQSLYVNYSLCTNQKTSEKNLFLYPKKNIFKFLLFRKGSQTSYSGNISLSRSELIRHDGNLCHVLCHVDETKLVVSGGWWVTGFWCVILFCVCRLLFLFHIRKERLKKLKLLNV